MDLFYIRFTHEDPKEGVAYFGPFPKDQEHKRLNDAAAVEMEEWGVVDSVPFDSIDPSKTYINPPEAWIAEALLVEEEGYEEE